MKMMNGDIFYLALMFYLATGAVINIEPNLSEEEIANVSTLLEKMIEKIWVDRMFENNVADIDSQNKQFINNDPENGDLQHGEKMICSWYKNTGTCYVNLPNIPKLIVDMTVVQNRMLVKASLNGYTFKSQVIHEITDVRSVSKEILQKQHDRKVKNNGNPHNEQLNTEKSEIGNLQMRKMKCSWKNKLGRCSLLLHNFPMLYINMTVVGTGIHVDMSFGISLILNTTLHGVVSKIFTFQLGPAYMKLKISVKNITSHYVKVCFRTVYTIDKKVHYIFSTPLGCPSKSFPTRKENDSVVSMKNLSKNFQYPLKFDPDMVYSVGENIDEENQNENSFMLHENDLKQNDK